MPNLTIRGVWTNVQGPADQSSFIGVDTNRLTWGTAAETQTSSYEFEGGNNSVEVDGSAFVLGTFTHHNYPIISPFTRFSVDLKITVTVAQGPTAVVPFTFNHYESPNVGPEAAWADVVSLAPLSQEDPWRAVKVVEIGGVACDLIFEGFYAQTGEFERTYSSPENGSNKAFIHVKLASYRGPQKP